MGTLIPVPRSLEEIREALISRYGEDYSIRLRRYNNLKQDNSESLREYADKLQRVSYGLNKPLQELVMKYLSTIRNHERIYPVLINLKFRSIREAMEAVERMSDEQPSFHQQSSKRCNNCGGFGHIARDCRKPPAKPAQRVAKVRVAEVEEEDDIDEMPLATAEYYSGESGEDNEVSANIF